MTAAQAYRTLLRLYPADYRAEFALEMENTFDRAVEEHRPGSLAFIRFLLVEFIGLFSGIAGEWIAKLTTDHSVRGRCLPDLRMMRPPGISRERWFAGGYQSYSEGSLPADVREAEARVSTLIRRIVHAIAHHDFPGARRYSDEERAAHDELLRLRQKYDLADSGNDTCS